MKKNTGNITAKYLIGELGEWINIVRPSDGRDEFGGVVAGETAVLDCWAQVDFPKTDSDELTQENRDFSRTRVVFTIRYLGAENVTEKMVVKWEGREHDIKFIQRTGRRQYAQLVTEQRR